MVQHGATTKSVDSEEINEFQLVHALITQSLKGLTDNGKSPSASVIDENQNPVPAAATGIPQGGSSIISTICQTFTSSFNSPDRHRLLPRSVRDIISQLRNSQDRCATSCVTKSARDKPRRKEKTASFHSKSSATEPQSMPQRSQESLNEIQQISSNVHKKVLHFEQCANTGQVEESLCSKCKKAKPAVKTEAQQASANTSRNIDSNETHNTNNTNSSSDTANPSCVVESCAGGTYYRSSTSTKGPPTAGGTPVTPIPNPPPEDQGERSEPPKLTGRNLKRVPSERFQKMRRKVQKLMHTGSDADQVCSSSSPRSSMDEACFLESIRIPNPAQIKNDAESQQGLILRLPDHVLCQIFALLDTRTLAALKCTCNDLNFVIVNFDVRGCDSRWTTDERYIDDPCKQCRQQFSRGDMSMCRYHPKRFYSDLPYGRSYWMCCHQLLKTAPGCVEGLHDNQWFTSYH